MNKNFLQLNSPIRNQTFINYQHLFLTFWFCLENCPENNIPNLGLWLIFTTREIKISIDIFGSFFRAPSQIQKCRSFRSVYISQTAKGREKIDLETPQLVTTMAKLPCIAPLMITIWPFDWLFGLSSFMSSWLIRVPGSPCSHTAPWSANPNVDGQLFVILSENVQEIHHPRRLHTMVAQCHACLKWVFFFDTRKQARVDHSWPG